MTFVIKLLRDHPGSLLNSATDDAWRSAYKITCAVRFCNFKTLFNNSLSHDDQITLT